jgi:hypothetical protein
MLMSPGSTMRFIRKRNDKTDRNEWLNEKKKKKTYLDADEPRLHHTFHQPPLAHLERRHEVLERLLLQNRVAEQRKEEIRKSKKSE